MLKPACFKQKSLFMDYLVVIVNYAFMRFLSLANIRMSHLILALLKEKYKHLIKKNFYKFNLFKI